MQQEHKLSPSLSHYWDCYVQLNGYTEDLVIRKSITHKNFNPIKSGQNICIWTHPCLVDVLGRKWSRLQSQGYPESPSLPSPAPSHGEHWCSSSAKSMPSPAKSNGGNPKPAGDCAPSSASEAPGEKVLCSPLSTTLTRCTCLSPVASHLIMQTCS